MSVVIVCELIVDFESNGLHHTYLFLVAKLLYKSKCPSVRMSTTFMGKRDFLIP